MTSRLPIAALIVAVLILLAAWPTSRYVLYPAILELQRDMMNEEGVTGLRFAAFPDPEHRYPIWLDGTWRTQMRVRAPVFFLALGHLAIGLGHAVGAALLFLPPLRRAGRGVHVLVLGVSIAIAWIVGRQIQDAPPDLVSTLLFALPTLAGLAVFWTMALGIVRAVVRPRAESASPDR